jgi:hypothetical protein
MGFLQPLLSKSKLARVAIVSFTPGEGGRRNRWGNNDDNDEFPMPPGTPLLMMDLRDVCVTSWSMGGSGGEGNISLFTLSSFLLFLDGFFENG